MIKKIASIALIFLMAVFIFTIVGITFMSTYEEYHEKNRQKYNKIIIEESNSGQIDVFKGKNSTLEVDYNYDSSQVLISKY